MSANLKDAVFAVVDVETTGLYPNTDRIVEIGIVRMQADGSIVDRFDSLVNPRRDVGPTSVHGITADLVDDAPEFKEIAGDVLAALSGAVWVGHNVLFDLRFIRAEYSRLGYALPDSATLCTLSLFRRFGPAAENHRLDCACSAYGISLDHAHCALCDAEATARLFSCLLADCDGLKANTVEELCELGLSDAPLAPVNLTKNPFPVGCRRVSRLEAAHRSTATKGGYIDSLLRRLPPAPDHQASDQRVMLYLNLLDRILEDRRIDNSEEAELFDLATEWGLTKEDVHLAHQNYMTMLLQAALEDNVITEGERRDINRVAALLHIDQPSVETMIEQVRQSRKPAAQPHADRHSRQLDLETVCFTGETMGPEGTPITRREATALAETAGLSVTRNVTKRLDLLVVADPDTHSAKAVKAREYGIRVVAAPVFWRMLGHCSDST